MMFFNYRDDYPWMRDRPATIAEVIFPHNPLPTVLKWPALLDTGSPFIILPGKCPKNGVFWSGEEVEVVLHLFDTMSNKQEIPIKLPVRGTPEGIRGFNGLTNWYLPFCAHLIVAGFVEEYHTVYFEEINHVIIGTPIIWGERWGLLQANGLSFW